MTSPPLAFTVAPDLIAATLGLSPMRVRAKAPAKPTFVAPAPATAIASNLLTPSPPISLALIFAPRLTPVAVTLATPIVA